ncbi:MAG: hypothetical protein MI673_04305, partial [Thiotrichales bacterium]|nr:hypothetical protein [Thiotrichales bacterium]
MQNAQARQARTLELAEFAHICADEIVMVESIADVTQDLFDRTLDLFELENGSEQPVARPDFTNRYIPLHDDLRTIYLFAEALGGYEQVNELVNENSPANLLSARIEKLLEQETLRPEDV